jgi:ribosome-associated protein
MRKSCNSVAVRDDDLSRRQLAKRARRNAGDQSADLARDLMKAADSTISKLEIEEELLEVIEKARAVTSPIARRRAERSLAGDLRRFELDELITQLANITATGVADSQIFHLAEQWRTRLIEDPAAADAFPGGNVEPLPALIADAKRERLTGKPPGAARVLFRHVMTVLRAQQP